MSEKTIKIKASHKWAPVNFEISVSLEEVAKKIQDDLENIVGIYEILASLKKKESIGMEEGKAPFPPRFLTYEIDLSRFYENTVGYYGQEGDVIDKIHDFLRDSKPYRSEEDQDRTIDWGRHDSVVKSIKIPKEMFEGDEIKVIDLFEKSGICSSKKDARQIIRQGGLYINKRKVLDEGMKISNDPKKILLAKGSMAHKAKFCIVHIE